jgi:small subunit ribosomal protein S2
MPVTVDMKELLEAGAHFGHKTSRWHPKMEPYIHSKRNVIHIIDLTKTAQAIEEATSFLSGVAASGKQILFVGTKRQAKDIVKETAIAVKQPYVSERWLGGMITNWNTIGGRVKHLKDLENRMANGELANRYNKLEVQRYQEEIDELNRIYGGVKELNGRPGAMFIVDVITEANAVKEANRLNIPIVAVVDSNADPTLITYPIPANDDAIKTVSLITGYVKQAIEEGVAKRDKQSNDAKGEGKD